MLLARSLMQHFIFTALKWNGQEKKKKSNTQTKWYAPNNTERHYRHTDYTTTWEDKKKEKNMGGCKRNKALVACILKSDTAWQSDRLLQSSKPDQHLTYTHIIRKARTQSIFAPKLVNFDIFIDVDTTTTLDYVPLWPAEGKKNKYNNCAFARLKTPCARRRKRKKKVSLREVLSSSRSTFFSSFESYMRKAPAPNPHQPHYRTTALCSDTVRHRRWMAATDCKHSRLLGRHSASIGATG